MKIMDFTVIMSSFTPNTIDIKEKLKLEKSLKENLERERELRLQEEIKKTEIERLRKQGNQLLFLYFRCKEAEKLWNYWCIWL